MSREEQKLQTRQRILDAAGRGFRRGGYGGVGVDALAGEAGVTSGAFYVHFGSKAAAFRETVVRAVADVGLALRQFQGDQPDSWWRAFVCFYLGERRKCDLADSCGLQTLTPEVARADAPARAAFEAELLAVAKTVVAGPPCRGAPRDIDSACAALAALIGAVTLARAVQSVSLADRIAAATGRLLLAAEDRATASRTGAKAKPAAPHKRRA